MLFIWLLSLKAFANLFCTKLLQINLDLSYFLESVTMESPEAVIGKKEMSINYSILEVVNSNSKKSKLFSTYGKVSVKYIWGTVFNNGPSKICGRQPLKNFAWFILEYFSPMCSNSVSDFWTSCNSTENELHLADLHQGFGKCFKEWNMTGFSIMYSLIIQGLKSRTYLELQFF